MNWLQLLFALARGRDVCSVHTRGARVAILSEAHSQGKEDAITGQNHRPPQTPPRKQCLADLKAPLSGQEGRERFNPLGFRVSSEKACLKKSVQKPGALRAPEGTLTCGVPFIYIARFVKPLTWSPRLEEPALSRLRVIKVIPRFTSARPALSLVCA